ncbi:MAG: hypothetical protein GY728_07890, partial [Phycisphaeraceae bacterium]|nr:hypothetical protein [Phycisphaeraceae bacterium]
MGVWSPGDRLTHRFNADLGPGVVRDVDDRTIEVYFPESDETLRLSATSDAIAPLVFQPGSRARCLTTGEDVIVEGDEEDG